MSRVGDGDCGTTLAQGARAIKADCCKRYPLNDAAATMNAVAESVGHSMGGSSGALYQIFFVALAGQSCCNLAPFLSVTSCLHKGGQPRMLNQVCKLLRLDMASVDVLSQYCHMCSCWLK